MLILSLVCMAVLALSSLAWAESKVFQLGFTVPATVQNQSPTYQSISTQKAIRNSKMVDLKTFVVP
jgi:hypothetical protein